MSKDDFAKMEREILERKFGPMEEADPLPKHIMDAYEAACASVEEFRRLALEATKGGPDYRSREVNSMTQSALSHLEESLGWITE